MSSPEDQTPPDNKPESFKDIRDDNVNYPDIDDLLDFHEVRESRGFFKLARRAKKEEKVLFSEEDNKKRNNHMLNVVFRRFIRVVAFVGIGIIVVRLLHLILPEITARVWIKQWLTPDQIQSIDKLFFSGAIGGVLTGYLKKSSNGEPPVSKD